MKVKIISLIGINPLPAGNFAVITAEIEPNNFEVIDSNGCIKRQYWTDFKIYKKIVNAQKAHKKLTNQGWGDFCVLNEIINYN